MTDFDAGFVSFVKQMAVELNQLGVRPGGVLLVHSSLRSLGLGKDIANKPELVICALLEALGADGTLLMPALSYAFVDTEQPVFDVRRTPSCIGAIPEVFRTRAGTLRSVHPTHSVSGVGRRAVELLGGHENDHTPCGANSPFSRLPDAGGQVLFLGCGMRPNTSMHAVEEHVEPAYLYSIDKDYQIIHADGSESVMRVRSHGFRGWQQRYERLEGLLPDGLAKGRVLQASCHLIEAAVMWPAALAALHQDPLFFVEQIPGWWEPKRDQVIEGALNWAMGQLGEAKYAGLCYAFCEDAYELGGEIILDGQGRTAREAADAYLARMATAGLSCEGSPPRGSYVFYDWLGTISGETHNWGHIGLALGDGRILHAWNVVRVDDLHTVEKLVSPVGGQPVYIGWAPPEIFLQGMHKKA
jgi:aminoglycoside 3-N-acetyltransferase